MITIHKTHSKYLSGLKFQTKIDDFEVTTDSSIGNEVKQAGVSPKKLMLASLAGCTGIDIASILNKMKVRYEDLSIDVEAELTDIHPKIYKKVHIIYSISIGEADKDKMSRAVQLSEEKYCGVLAMFKHFAETSSEIRYRALSAASKQ